MYPAYNKKIFSNLKSFSKTLYSQTQNNISRKYNDIIQCICTHCNVLLDSETVLIGLAQGSVPDLESKVMVPDPRDACGKAVRQNQNSIQCDGCSSWHHMQCQGMITEIHKIMIEHESYTWNCMKCGLPNFNTTYFDGSPSIDLSTSTPAKKISQKFGKKQISKSLKILNINCQSIVNQRTIGPVSLT